MNMSVKLGIVAWTIVGAAVVGCSGSDGAPGATGATGPAGSAGGGGTENPSVSAITPGTSYLARTTDVTVSGYGTAWSAATTMDFGADVKVNKITVASPTALVANITIAKTAAPGARDVTVTDGSNKEVYKGAFNLAPPAALKKTGTLAQGSIVSMHVALKDLSTPFDTTTTGDGFTSPITHSNIAINDVTGATIQLREDLPVTIAGFDFDMFIDVTAPTTAQAIEIVSGPATSATTNDDFPIPGGATIAARAPIALTAGTPVTGNTMNPMDSVLYQFTPSAATLAIVDFIGSSSDAGVSPELWILPKSGKFIDAVARAGAPTILTQSTDVLYAVYRDSSGATGPFSLLTKSTAAAATLADTEPNNTKAAAQIATALPFVLTAGTLPADTDQDWIQYTAVAADVGKSFHVQTIGDSQTDTLVDVFSSNGTTSLGGPSDDLHFQEDFVSSPITAAGVYYIQISASQAGFFDPAHKAYQAVIRLQ